MTNDLKQTKEYLDKFYLILNQMEYKMLNELLTNNITIYFINCMIPHHQAAIYMCENLLKYTEFAPLQNIAHQIIRTQTKGIKQMKYIKETTYGFNNNYIDVENYYNNYLAITNNMISKMKNSLNSTNIDLDFISEMIPHHEGAIEMCNNLLKYKIDPRLSLVAKSIVKEQSRGVMQLKYIRGYLSNNNI